MIRHVHVSLATRDALRTLAGRAIERIFVTGEVRVVRRLRDDARRLEVRSPDGRRYSGVLVVHGNEITTGAVVPTDIAAEDAAADASGCENADSSPPVASALLSSVRPGEIASALPEAAE